MQRCILHLFSADVHILHILKTFWSLFIQLLVPSVSFQKHFILQQIQARTMVFAKVRVANKSIAILIFSVNI